MKTIGDGTFSSLAAYNPIAVLRKYKAHPAARLIIVPTRYLQGLLIPYYLRIKRPFARVWSNKFQSSDVLENTLRISSHWNTVFHKDTKTYGARTPHTSDRSHVIEAFHRTLSFRGKTVLELGHLEGGNSKQMLELGAEKVTGIESHPEAFLKSLLAQNAFALHQAEFVFGDFNSLLAEVWPEDKQFDICLACGVLYHMSDPVRTIDLICKRASVIHVWTQVGSEISPKGPWVNRKDSAGRIYRGRKKIYTLGAHLGGIQSSAVWLCKEDLLRAFTDRGFRILDLEESNNRNGSAVRFTACRE